MRGNDELIALLNDLLTNELTAINQYLLHAATCERWGYHRLAAKLRDESTGESSHADMLIERILFLEGTPNVQRYNTVHGGASVKELLEADLAMEYAAIAALESAIARSRALLDHATEDLLTKIVVAEQDDTQWIEAQLEQMRQLGEQTYLAQQLHGS